MLGRYLRGEPWTSSEELAELREQHAEASAMDADLYEQQAASNRERVKEQSAQRKRKPKVSKPPFGLGGGESDDQPRRASDR
ncbi:hypothetical protein [Amycolatopsis sp. cmx-4-54]|uniref:hypothetical protein n=1 Tax=Amycolatopsis sp. cmx-4-54 TaxID=2790936 RepID=UPI00397C71BB